MKNLRELFTEYHAGFQDYGPWLNHHYEMHKRHPLDCPEFGAEWLRRWEALGRLLLQSAEHRAMFAPGEMSLEALGCLSDCLIDAIQSAKEARLVFRRVRLLDGTVVKEWKAK